MFKIYYENLDAMRENILKQEYSIRDTMTEFDKELKQVIANLSKFSLLEFYHDEVNIKKSISNLQSKLENFSIYLPEWRLKIENIDQVKTQIKVDVRERLNSIFERIDHSFAIENYHFVLEKVNDIRVKDIYKKLGPFNHFEFIPASDETVQRNLRLDFDRRKSGAMFRGQTNANDKPDGYGFKVYPNNSIFEGYFTEGQVNIWGRGITAKGEVYQGPFSYDAMQGKGLF